MMVPELYGDGPHGVFEPFPRLASQLKSENEPWTSGGPGVPADTSMAPNWPSAPLQFQVRSRPPLTGTPAVALPPRDTQPVALRSSAIVAADDTYRPPLNPSFDGVPHWSLGGSATVLEGKKESTSVPS